MQKKLFGILLVLCMMFAVLGISAAAEDIAYYVNAETGDDTNENAGTEGTPFKTFDAAMTAASSAATTAEDTVTVYINGTVAVGTGSGYVMPNGYAGTIKIVGVNDTTPTLSFGGSGIAKFYLNGSLEIENIAFDNGAVSSSKRVYLVAQNNKLVLGSGITMEKAQVVVLGGYYLDKADTGKFSIDSDVTILSGKYEIVTGGTMYSGSIVAEQPQLEEADIDIVIGSDEDVTITRFAPFGVYGNQPYDDSSTLQATVRIVGDNVTVSSWYYGVMYYDATTCADIYNVDLILQGLTSGITFKNNDPEKYAVDYNIYFDTRKIDVDENWLTSRTDACTLNVKTVDTYETYCDDYIGHTFGDGDTCTNCGLEKAKCGHTFTTDKVTTTATCKTEKVTTKTCNSCGYEYTPVTGTIDSSNHESEAYNWTVNTEAGTIALTWACCGADLITLTPAATDGTLNVYVSDTGVNAGDVTTELGTAADKAFTDFDLAMNYAALAATEGVTVTVHVDGTVAVPENDDIDAYVAYVMPDYDGTISIVGADDASLTFGASEMRFLSNGALEISNVKLGNTAKLYFVAQSNKLVMGEGITNTSNDYLVCVVGDCMGGTGDSIASDVTIRSGKYSLVTAGAYSNSKSLKGRLKLTLGAFDSDTLAIDRLAPFAAMGGRTNNDITADITVDGNVTVASWVAERLYGNNNNTSTYGGHYFVNLYLEGDITDGNDPDSGKTMFQRNPNATSTNKAGSNVTYNIYYDSTADTDGTLAADAALFKTGSVIFAENVDGQTVDGNTSTLVLSAEASISSVITVNTHTSVNPGFDMTIDGSTATFICNCGCKTVLATSDLTTAETIYVSENGVTLAKDVDSTIGTTEATAFADFDMAMKYAAAAATEGNTVTVTVVGAVNVPANYAMPEYAGTIKIVGTEGASLCFGGADTAFYSNGSLEIENIEFANSSKKIYIAAQNNELVLGSGLSMTNATVYVMGGYYLSTASTYDVKANLTVRSGKYSVVTGGSYQNNTDETATTIKGGDTNFANITLGATGEDTLEISRFSPFGVYENALSADVNATVVIDGAVTIPSGAQAGWYVAVMYGSNMETTHTYNVDLIIKGDISISQFANLLVTYAADYNVYYDTRVSTAEEDANTFVTGVVSDTATIAVTSDPYYTYCTNVLGGHIIGENKADAAAEYAATTAYKCDACEECGYTYHAAKKDATWTFDEDTRTYTFPCQCDKGNLTTSEKPYVYVGGYSVTITTDDAGKTTTTEEATSGTVDGMGASDSPITTIREAVRRMATTGGEVILTADRDINNDISFVEYTENITFKSICGNDGKPLFGFVCKNLGACFNLNGPTTFEYIKFDMPGTVSGETDGSAWTMPMTLVFAAHWNDLTFGEGISTLGQAYVVAGTNRLSYDTTNGNVVANDGTYIDDKEVTTQTITFNKVESRADAQNDNKTLTFYATIYLGDRINNITAPYVLKDKNVTAIFNDAQCGLIYSGTTASTTYATTGEDDGEEGGEVDNNTGDGTGSGDTTNSGTSTASEESSTDSGTDTTATVNPDIVQLIGCKTTIKFNGETVVYRIRTGYENTYQGSSSLDELNIHFNDNSSVSDTQNIGIVLYNVKNLNVYIPGTRTAPLAQRIHGSLSDQFLAYRAAQKADGETVVDLTATATYTSHSVDVYPRFNYNFDKVTRNYVDDHNFVLSDDGTAFVCSVCEKTMADAAMSPVVITAKPISAKNGEIEVGYYYSWTGDGSAGNNYTGSTGLEYSVREKFNSFSFDVVTPAGLTLKEGSLKLNNFGSAEEVRASAAAGKAPTGWSGAISGNNVTITNVLEDNALISNNRLVATAVFTVDENNLANFNVEKYPVENVSASYSNEDYQIVPAVVYEVATKTYKQGFYLGVTLLSEYVLEYLVPVKDDISGTATWMVFEKEYKSKDGDGNVVTKTLTTAATPEEELKNGMWRFAVPGIAGKQMNDNISGTYYYIRTDGFIYRANTKSYNLTNYYKVAVGSASTELKAVLNAMFCYGAAAQTYFGYDAANLVTANTNVVGNYAVPSLDNITASYEFEKETGGTYTYVFDGQDAVLDQRIGISLYFDADSVTSETDVSGLVFNGSYKNINGSTLPIEISGDNISVVAVEEEDGTVDYRIRVYIDTIAAKDLRQEFAGELYNGETKVSPTITTSFEAYASKAIAMYAETSLATLCKAILAYSDAAAGYLKITQ